MDFDAARQIGDEAERLVAAELARLKPLFGFDLLNDVLIGVSGPRVSVTAQLDHVLIDQYGVLIIETKARNGALIRGSYAEKNWTACYPGGSNHPFQNPLRQNDQHIHELHKMLKERGRALSLDCIRGLVVLVGCDTTHIELDSITEGRVATLGQLQERLRVRHDFVIAIPMTVEERAVLTQTLFSLDRSTDPILKSAHSAHRAAHAASARRPRSTRPGGTASDRRSWTPYAAQSGPAPHKEWSKALPIIALGAAVVFGLWILQSIFSGTASIWVWVVVILLLMVFGRSESGSRSRQGRNRAGSSATAISRMAGVVLASIALVSLFLCGTYWVILQTFGGHATQATPGAAVTPAATPLVVPTPALPTPAVATPVGSTTDVRRAREALREIDPQVYAVITNPDQPDVQSDGANLTYAWTYIVQPEANQAQVRTIEITLDPSGRVIGASRP